MGTKEINKSTNKTVLKNVEGNEKCQFLKSKMTLIHTFTNGTCGVIYT